MRWWRLQGRPCPLRVVRAPSASDRRTHADGIVVVHGHPPRLDLCARGYLPKSMSAEPDPPFHACSQAPPACRSPPTPSLVRCWARGHPRPAPTSPAQDRQCRCALAEGCPRPGPPAPLCHHAGPLRQGSRCSGRKRMTAEPAGAPPSRGASGQPRERPPTPGSAHTREPATEAAVPGASRVGPPEQGLPRQDARVVASAPA